LGGKYKKPIASSLEPRKIRHNLTLGKMGGGEEKKKKRKEK